MLAHDASFFLRNKVLSNELKATKQQLTTLMDKGKHDDELISALLVSLCWSLTVPPFQPFTISLFCAEAAGAAESQR